MIESGAADPYAAARGRRSRESRRTADSMLATRLASLAEAGLLTRTVDDGPPVSVAYQLTDAGRALLPALERICRRAGEHLPAPPPSRTRTPAGRRGPGGAGPARTA